MASGSMRSAYSGLALVLALVIAALAMGSAAPTPARSVPLRAAAVSMTLNYSDPAGDVFEMWTSNNSHVTDASGNWLKFGTPMSVDLQRVASNDLGANVQILLKVRASVSALANTTYEYRLYTRQDNATHYIVTFRNGTTTMVTNHTDSQVWNLTANTTVGGVTSLGWLGVIVNKTALGGSANITAWDMDAQAKMASSPYSYVDYVWSLPGNPGSAPAFIQGRVTDAANGAGLANVNVSTNAGGYFTTTNATGYYSLPASPGNYTLTFSLTGYDTATKPVSVQEQQTQTVNAALTKASDLSSLLWIVAVVLIVVAAAAIVFLVARRRKPRAPK